MAISKELKDLQDRRAEQKAILDDMLKGKTEEDRLTVKQNQKYKETIKILKEINEQTQEYQAENKIVIDNLIQQESKLKGLGGIQASLVSLDRERLTAQQNLDGSVQNSINSIASLNQDLLSMSREDSIARELQIKNIDEQIELLRGISTVNEDILKNLKQQRDVAYSLSSLTEHQKEQLDAQIKVYDGLKKSIGAIFDTAQLLTSSLSAGIGLTVVALGQVVGKIGEVNKQFGMTLFSADGVARKTALMNVFFDDAVGTTQELASQFGSTEAASFRTQLNTNLMAMNLGISGKEAATLVGSFARLNGGSIQIANNLITSTKELAKQRGVIPSKVMSDLANNTEAFALYAKNGGTNLAEAGIYAQQLGVDMGVLIGVADNLLDFETSITKELELSAMLGRNINLNQARQLAYEGEIEKATAETLRQLGGIDEFNKMDVFQKRSAAQLLGVNVAQLQQMVDLEAKANTEVGMMSKSWNTLNESATALTNTMGGPFLSTLGSSLVALGQMGFNVKGILGLEKLRAWWAQKTAVWRTKETTELATINALKAKGITIDNAGRARDAAGKFTKLPTAITTPNPTPTTGGVGGLTNSISKINMNSVLKGAAALVIVAGAMFILGKALQEFEGIGWDTLKVAGVALLGLVLSVAALSIVGKFAIIGAAALLVVASAVLVLGNALQAIGTGFTMMSSGITTLVPTLSSVGSVVSGLVTQIAPITLLSTAFFGLAASLMAVGVAGLAALPALTAIAVAGGVVGTVARLVGVSGDTTDGGKSDELLTEIRALRKDLTGGKVAVYMDGRKVTASIDRVVDRIGSNFYGIA
jgi:hypothetical protein